MDESDVDEIIALIAGEGLFSQKIPHFKPRIAQMEMVRAVFKAYFEQRIALIEAATGTGKSIAYLLAALFWAIKTGERTVISTNTIALQEQLIKKDIPNLLKVLSIDLKVSLAKGMHNYLCLRKLEDLNEEREEIDRIKKRAFASEDGSYSEIPGVNKETWEKIAAESESCTHIKCPHYKECFFFKARAAATESKIVVANHHLLFADLSRRFESNNYSDDSILPTFSRLILDEAHHVEDVAIEYFAKKVSEITLLHLINRLLGEKNRGKLKILHQKLSDFFLHQKSKSSDDIVLLSALELDLPIEKRELTNRIENLFAKLKVFLKANGGEEKLRLRENHLKTPLWKEIQTEVKDVVFQSRRWTEQILGCIKKIEENEHLKSKCEGSIIDIKGLLKRLETIFSTLLEFAFSSEEKNLVKWIEINREKMHLVEAKLNISELIKESLFDKMKTVVLTSATLATKGSFSFIKQTLGITEADEKIYSSTFDYEKRTLFCVPMDMVEPSSTDFLKMAAKQILSTLEISLGHAFILFTSYDALRQMQELIAKELTEKKYPLFCQGDAPSAHLLQKFKSASNPILLGTDSFWEGVDIVGDHLRCVIIVKLPFLVPVDPFFQAKSEALKAEGKSPFFDYSLPAAAMKFKQGFGRLMRSENDRGCIVCLDPRIARKGYGKTFLHSLPPSTHCFQDSEQLKITLKEFFQDW